ncbi:hypothetical protein [Sorangium sp. So ce388]|uniref:hypothetical protein n=1 Tax=Sorangium sp. So ce388 TaxID=3133309 RepID=UPI003F5B6743
MSKCTASEVIRLPRFTAVGAMALAYVIKVMGAVEPDEPETQALADQLLAPLARWSVGSSAR